MKIFIIIITFMVLTSCDSYNKKKLNDSLPQIIKIESIQKVKIKCPIDIGNAVVKKFDNYTNGIFLILKNTSNKSIDGIKVTIECYDNFGALITKIDGVYQKTLIPKKSELQIWESPSPLVTHCKVFVFLVHFKDGSKWEL